MNRSVCKVIVGVAGLAVLGMTATLAGAQTDEAADRAGVCLNDGQLHAAS
jgi:hypothetical protein